MSLKLYLDVHVIYAVLFGAIYVYNKHGGHDQRQHMLSMEECSNGMAIVFLRWSLPKI